jgi:hypothetical protein
MSIKQNECMLTGIRVHMLYKLFKRNLPVNDSCFHIHANGLIISFPGSDTFVLVSRYTNEIQFNIRSQKTGHSVLIKEIGYKLKSVATNDNAIDEIRDIYFKVSFLRGWGVLPADEHVWKN